MKDSIAVKLLAAILTAIVLLICGAVCYGLVYFIGWCFDIDVTFKTATGAIFIFITAHLTLTSIFGGKK